MNKKAILTLPDVFHCFYFDGPGFQQSYVDLRRSKREDLENFWRHPYTEYRKKKGFSESPVERTMHQLSRFDQN